MNSVEELMVREGLLTDEQLHTVKIRQRHSSGHLKDALRSLDLLEEKNIARFFNPVPPLPRKIADTGLDESFLVDLLLRSCLEIPVLCQAPQHNASHSNVNPGFIRPSETLAAFAKPSRMVQPAKSTLNYPAAR